MMIGHILERTTEVMKTEGITTVWTVDARMREAGVHSIRITPVTSEAVITHTVKASEGAMRKASDRIATGAPVVGTRILLRTQF